MPFNLGSLFDSFRSGLANLSARKFGNAGLASAIDPSRTNIGNPPGPQSNLPGGGTFGTGTISSPGASTAQQSPAIPGVTFTMPGQTNQPGSQSPAPFNPPGPQSQQPGGQSPFNPQQPSGGGTGGGTSSGPIGPAPRGFHYENGRLVHDPQGASGFSGVTSQITAPEVQSRINDLRGQLQALGGQIGILGEAQNQGFQGGDVRGARDFMSAQTRDEEEDQFIQQEPEQSGTMQIAQQIQAILGEIANTSGLTLEEQSLQQRLDNILTSSELGVEKVRTRPVATPFITGQASAIQRQAAQQAMPLERQLSRLAQQRAGNREAMQTRLQAATTLLPLAERQERDKRDREQATRDEIFTIAQSAAQGGASANEIRAITNARTRAQALEMAAPFLQDQQDDLLSVAEAKSLGVPYGTPRSEAFGVTPSSSGGAGGGDGGRVGTAGEVDTLNRAGLSNSQREAQNFFLETEPAFQQLWIRNIAPSLAATPGQTFDINQMIQNYQAWVESQERGGGGGSTSSSRIPNTF